MAIAAAAAAAAGRVNYPASVLSALNAAQQRNIVAAAAHAQPEPAALRAVPPVPESSDPDFDL